MPATIVHSFFAEDVYDILPSYINRKLDLGLCKTFGQSVDSLKFYNLFSLKSGKSMRKFQGYFHNNKTQEFFINLLHYIHDNKFEDKEVYSFLVGFICHYALDSTLHPYIIYKTGHMEKGKPNTYKYNNIHAFMESFLDMDMVHRRKRVNPYKYDFINYCFDISRFSQNLVNTINYSFYNTYQVNDMSNIYYKSLKQMKWALKTFRKDPKGRKKFCYKVIDTFTPRSCFRFEAVSYYYPLTDNHNFLNRNHKLWRNPTTYNMTSEESFIDLYIKAIKHAKVLVCASFDYLADKGIDLEQLFDNTSYITGLNCDLDTELKYFEF